MATGRLGGAPVGSGRVVLLQELHEVQVNVHTDDALVVRKGAACMVARRSGFNNIPVLKT